MEKDELEDKGANDSRAEGRIISLFPEDEEVGLRVEGVLDNDAFRRMIKFDELGQFVAGKDVDEGKCATQLNVFEALSDEMLEEFLLKDFAGQTPEYLLALYIELKERKATALSLI